VDDQITGLVVLFVLAAIVVTILIHTKSSESRKGETSGADTLYYSLNRLNKKCEDEYREFVGKIAEAMDSEAQDGEIRVHLKFAGKTPRERKESKERISDYKRRLNLIREEINLRKQEIKWEFDDLNPELPALGTGRYGVKEERHKIQSLRAEIRRIRDQNLAALSRLNFKTKEFSASLQRGLLDLKKEESE
jgi:hypothetical protein